MHFPPLIYLAFANARGNPAAFLKELKRERQSLDDLLTSCEWCNVKVHTEATLSRIQASFEKYREAIRIFHFSGHAGGAGIEVETEDGGNRTAFVQGLAGFIGQQKGVRLVFLNGCSTEAQIQAYHRAGIPAVIATRYPVRDDVATAFSQHFYEGLVRGASLQQAFDDACQKLLMPFPSPKDLYRRMQWSHRQDPDQVPHPYELALAPGHQAVAEEKLKDWHRQYLAQKPDDPATEIVPPDAYLLCDRSQENKTFERRIRRQLEEGARQPQFFLIHGRDDEEPNSLARRFVRYSIQEIMELEQGRIRVRRKPYLIELPDKRDFAHPDADMPRYQLQQALKSALKIRGAQVSAREVLLQAGRQVDVVFLQHNLIAEQWHKNLPELLRYYLQDFWRLELKARDPRVILLFNVVYQRQPGLKKLFGGPGAAIEKALQQLAAQIEPCTLIQKLRPVAKGDVVKWRLEWLPDEDALTERLYSGSKNVPMRQVQRELKYAIERHNEQCA